MAEPIRDRLDDVLATLPSSYVVAGQNGARLVVGPHGAFVLLPAGGDLQQAADRLAKLTSITREAMCEHLTLVPFLDALAVTSGATPRHAPVTVAPLDLLTDVLTHGPEVIDSSTLDTIRHAVRATALDGWSVGLTAVNGDGEINLRDRAQPSATAI